MNGSKDCLSAPPDTKAGSPVVLGSCDGRVSEWLFTLTGALMVSHVMVENHRRETLLTVANLFSVTMNLEILLLFKNMKDVMSSSVGTEKPAVLLMLQNRTKHSAILD